MSSDDEAPEAFSFTASKKAAKGEAQALSEFHVQEKKKLKDRRRERDRNLKERKELSQVGKTKLKHSSKGGDKTVGSKGDGKGRDLDLEARMERAMRKAEEESDEDGDSEDEPDDTVFNMEGVEDDDSGSEGSEEDEEMESVEEEEEDEEDEEEEEEEEEEPISSSKTPRAQKLDYLPDHVFASAFSQPESTSSSSLSKGKGKSKQDANSDLPSKKKRKRSKRTAKDILVGGRTIRTLSSNQTQSSVSVSLPKTLAPTSQMNHFLGRSLNLRGEATNAKLRGWERRSANVGVMKRMGPAAQFVRS